MHLYKIESVFNSLSEEMKIMPLLWLPICEMVSDTSGETFVQFSNLPSSIVRTRIDGFGMPVPRSENPKIRTECHAYLASPSMITQLYQLKSNYNTVKFYNLNDANTMSVTLRFCRNSSAA